MIGDGKLLASAASMRNPLNELKAKAGRDPAANIRPVARQVEAGCLCRHDAEKYARGLPKDGLFSSDQTRLYTSMYDQQTFQQMTAGKWIGAGGYGLTDDGRQTMLADDAPQVPLKFSPETVNSYQNQALTQLVRKAI